MKDSIEVIAILVIFIIERFFTHRYLVEQNKLQKLSNFLSQHYKFVDEFFINLEIVIASGLVELNLVEVEDLKSYRNVLAIQLNKIKKLNSDFHSKIIIPISTIENSKYKELNQFSNDFIDLTTKKLDSPANILKIIEKNDFEEYVNFYRTRVYRTLHSS